MILLIRDKTLVSQIKKITGSQHFQNALNPLFEWFVMALTLNFNAIKYAVYFL